MIENIEQHEYNLFQNFYLIGIHASKRRKFPYNLTTEVLSKFPKTKLPYLFIPNELVINFVFPNGITITEKEPSTEFFIFSLENISTKTIQSHPRIYFGCFIFPELLLNLNPSQSKVQKYGNKAIVLSSFYPFYQEMHLILSKLYQEMNSNKMQLTIEQTITSLLCDIPTPPPTFTIDYIFLSNTKVTFKQAPINHLPNYSIDLKPIVYSLSPESIIKITKCLMLELPIVVFSENKYELSCIIEGLVSLLFPFKYPHTVVSVLPCVYYSLMQNVDSFIIGINERYREDYFEKKEIDLRGKNVVMVALRYGKQDEAVFFQKKVNKCQRLISLSQIINADHIDTTINANGTTAGNNSNSSNSIGGSTINTTMISGNINASNTGMSDNLSASASSSYRSFSGLGSYVGSVMGNVIGTISSGIGIISGFGQGRQITKSKVNLFTDVPLPKHYCEKIISKIQETFYEKQSNNLKQWTDTSNSELREIMFYLYIALFVNYQQYLTIDEKTIIDLHPKIKDNSISINSLFKIDEFLQACANDLQFYSSFLQTHLWSDFLMRKFYPITNEDKLIILFFDEHIFRKKNRTVKKFSKYKTPFIEMNYSNTKQSILGPKAIEQVIQYENFPEMHFEDIMIKLDATAINLFDTYDNTIINTLQNHSGLYENYSILGYNINMGMKLKIDMDQYIIKLWFKMFSLTFWEVNAKEKWYRFNQMITLLSNYLHTTRYIDESIQHELLNTIILYGDMQMASMLFSFLPHGSFLIYTLIHEKFLQNTQSYNQYNYTKERNFNIFNTSNLISPSISSSSNTVNAINNNQGKYNTIEFLPKFQCEKCSTEYDIRQFTLSLKEIKSDSIYFTCPKCQNRFPATLRIKSDNNPSSSLATTTAVVVGSSPLFISVSLSTPLYVFNRLRRSDKISFKKFYQKNKDLFWNMVWYFELKGLPYDCLFPYQTDTNSFKYDSSLLIPSLQSTFSLIKADIKYEDTLMKGVEEMFFDKRSNSLAKLNQSISFQAANEARKKSISMTSSTFFVTRTNSTKSPPKLQLLKGTK